MFVIVFLTVCGLMLGTRSQETVFVPCEDKSSSPYTGPPLPIFPDQYQVTVEANIVQKKYTLVAREYYDYVKDRYTWDWYSLQHGTNFRDVSYPENQEVRKIYPNGTCIVESITQPADAFFKFISGPNGTHVRSVKDLMAFGSEYGEEYMGGDETVRGIPVDHWQACLKYTHSDVEFILDFYFTKDSDYIVDGIQVRVPVRAVLRGKGETMHDDSSGHRYHYYEFTDFHAGQIKDQSVFEVPPGVYCNGSKISKPLPVVHAQFTAGVEQVTEVGDEHTERQVTLYMDQSSNVVRLDATRPFTQEQVKQFGDKPLVYISDDSTGILYIIDKWERNCTIVRVADSSDLPILTSAGQFLAIFQQEFVYQGQKIFRGFDVESWASFNTSENVITELLFHEVHIPGYESTLMSGPGQGPSMPNAGQGQPPLQPVGVIIKSLEADLQPSTQTVMHFYGFTPSHPAPEVFDVSSCYSLGHHFVYMALQVEGNYETDVQYRKHEFVTALQSAIARAAGVSVTRVTSVLVGQSPYDKIKIIAYFKLLDNKVDGISPDTVGPDLSQAKVNLQDAITNGLNFDVHYPTIERNFIIAKDTLLELPFRSTRNDKPSDKQQYSAGAMAGLGVGMVVVGALLGLLGAFVMYKKMDTSVPYRVT